MKDSPRRWIPEVVMISVVAAIVITACLAILGGCASGPCAQGACNAAPHAATGARPIVHGYYVQSGCTITYAAGCDTGVSVPNPCDDGSLWIAPGAVAAWGEPVALEEVF